MFHCTKREKSHICVAADSLKRWRPSSITLFLASRWAFKFCRCESKLLMTPKGLENLSTLGTGIPRIYLKTFLRINTEVLEPKPFSHSLNNVAKPKQKMGEIWKRHIGSIKNSDGFSRMWLICLCWLGNILQWRNRRYTHWSRLQGLRNLIQFLVNLRAAAVVWSFIQ